MSIFQCNFTPSMLRAMIPHNQNVPDWFNALSVWLPKYNITSKSRVAAFLAQTIHESAEFSTLQENLHYSAAGLLAVFPKYFDAALAEQYAKQPEKIANRVYANRNGNGDEASGDGWKFSGKGAIMITFKNSFVECSQFLYGDNRLVDDPSILTKTDDALGSACWYWMSRNLNDLADGDNFAAITVKINGGLNGEAQRVALYNKALNLL